MKHLIIESAHYHYLEQSFSEWLSTLGYAAPTVGSWPVHVRELFYYLEQRGIRNITAAHPRHITGFLSHLKTRTNLSYGGGLSSSHINKSISALTVFGRYLLQSGRLDLDISLRCLPSDAEARTILTKAELLKLYDGTFSPYPNNSLATGQRDRAIIAVFYGCGLRRSEGVRLNLSDIDTVKGLLFVRKGKGNKQRHVPIARRHSEDIKAYLAEGRRWFLEDHYSGHYQSKKYGTAFKKKEQTDDEAFFLNQWGARMGDFAYRLRQMKERAALAKDFSLHSLRHSIATHLLQSGMDIEEIGRFLGHSSLESTQIYTHIVAELKEEDHDHETTN